jgi:hypothetical protein
MIIGKTWALNTLQECISTHPNDRTREQANQALAYLQNWCMIDESPTSTK